MNYSIENLDVYRRSIVACTRICKTAAAAAAAGKGGTPLTDELRQKSFSLVSNLADGLGFWERSHKVEHFTASKRAVLESLPLVEVLAAMKLITEEEQRAHAEDLRDLARMISGLLRGAKGTGKKIPSEKGEAAAVGEERVSYH